MDKLLVAFAFSLLLVGCDDNKQKNTPDFTSQIIETVAEGEICGGAERIKCQSGLECSDKNPTKTGICMALAEGDIQCPETKNPVCGLKGDNKNGYLNECEAGRHGAKILYEGFCKPDETIANNCESSPISIGNCEAWFEGAYFDKDTKECQTIGLAGCSADIPFENIGNCKTACEDKK